MSQSAPDIITGSTLPGGSGMQATEDSQKAQNSNNSGTSKSSYAEAGSAWFDTTNDILTYENNAGSDKTIATTDDIPTPVSLVGINTAYINGGVPTDTSTIILTMTACSCLDTLGTTALSETSGALTLTTNADWASGTAPTLTDASVHCFITESGFIFDDVTGTNIVGAKRRIFSVLLDGSGELIPFDCKQLSNGMLRFRYDEAIITINDSSPITSARIAAVMPVPLGIKSNVFVSMLLLDNDAVSAYVIVTETSSTDVVPDGDICTLAANNLYLTAVTSTYNVDEDGKLYYRSSDSGLGRFVITLSGYMDRWI